MESYVGRIIMSGGLEWAAQYEEKQNILKTTSRLQVNLKTWDDGLLQFNTKNNKLFLFSASTRSKNIE